ncbi:lysylphosphatidylglycerol synthase domain-containing protein [Leptospira johnsonii]|uniref:Membrane protein n=1 Tax=Leptospira johnsonii TaxID=1917820 RepID=A0A2P2D2M3_9LEPT|nr:lysylphosphatidylglycerol synthase domain-containing protein [Leptospira johnsonii]GBF38919.1 membrane protein [Leptospira johnsonii]
MDKKKRSTYVSIVLYVLIFSFLAFYFRKIEWSRFYDIEFNWLYILLSVPISLLIRFISPLAWVFLIKSFGQKINSYLQLNYVYAKSWLGRYIPGSVLWIAGKVYFATEQGISKKVLLLTSFLEAAVQVFTGAVVALLFIVASDRLPFLQSQVRYVLLLILIGFAVFLYPGVFNFIFRKAYKIYKKEELDESIRFRWSTLLQVGIIFSLIHAVSGIPFFFILKTVYPALEYTELIYVSGVTTLAGVIGIVVIFVPSGLGVRDGIQLVLLSKILPDEIVIVSVILLRLWSIVLDFAFWLISYVLKTFFDRPKVT